MFYRGGFSLLPSHPSISLALSQPDDRNAGPYLSQLLFHLIGDGENDRRVKSVISLRDVVP